MKASDICLRAAELVTGDREKTHGDKRENFTYVARLWNAYIRNLNQAELTAIDVGQMMVLLKMGRTQSGEPEAEHFIDEVGYAACVAELATETNR